MTAPLLFALVPSTLIEQIAWAWDECEYECAGESLDVGREIRKQAARLTEDSPGNDLLDRIVRALNTHAVNLKNDGFDQASEDVEALLNEIGGGHG